MKNFSEKLKMALWVFSPIVIVLSIYTIYLFEPIKKNATVETTNSYELPKKTQRIHSFHRVDETDKESSSEM